MVLSRRELIVALSAAFMMPAGRIDTTSNGCAVWVDSDSLSFLDAFSTRKILVSASVIGNALLKESEISLDQKTIEARLDKSIYKPDRLNLGVRVAPNKRGSIRERIRQCIARDFAEGKIIEVRGWLLAETEAHLCALVALRSVPDSNVTRGNVV